MNLKRLINKLYFTKNTGVNTMKYNNKLELIEAIKNNANLFIEEYSGIENVSINIVDKEIKYSPYQMLVFCLGKTKNKRE